MKYELKEPVALGENGPPITILVFRERITAGDLRGIKARSLVDPSVEDLLTIAGRLCAQPDAVMNKLGLEDFNGVLGVLGPLLQAGRETGTAPSPS